MSEKFSGADWVEKELLSVYGRGGQISPLGRRVADLLGDLLSGIYHLDGEALQKVEWDNPHHMSVLIYGRDWATYDNEMLTRIVFLAHDYCVRVSLDPARNDIMRVWFHDRKRDGMHIERHPDLETAVSNYRRFYEKTDQTEQPQ